MAKAKLKRVIIPKFSSEAKEAAWWDAHRVEIEADVRRRMKLGNPLTLGGLLQGERPSQPVTLRLPREDLQTARRLATQKGLGYQTYIKMLLREALAENASEGAVNNFCSWAEVESGFQYWSRIASLSHETREGIEKSDIVLVPAEGYGDYSKPVFPKGTDELFQFFRANAPSQIGVELAVEDADYRELALHGDTLHIATLLVTLLGAPVAVGLIVEYLKKHLGSRLGKTDVRAHVILDQGDGSADKTLKISYEGPADTFERTMNKALSSISGGQVDDAELAKEGIHSLSAEKGRK
jgi:hypothetical protein